MHIHCPHCCSPIEVVDEQELRDVICPSCGSSFNLLPDETVTRSIKEQRNLGHFTLMDRIGVGAFGEVWTAHDGELDRTVAIKLPRKGQLSADEAESFLREARSAARLNHPGIVAVHEVGKVDDQLFIVSDFVRGVTLADWLTANRPTPREAAELVVKLADAVQHAHEHGVIHRDLKPSNIMLDDYGQPHIMDFGLAKREAGEITMTLEGKILGTPAYMSPEQAKGAAHDADARSDVYSLGVILFELLTGQLPFRGNARMLVNQVINDEPPTPRLFNSGVARDLETVCLQCLEKEPRKRYATAEDLAQELRRFLAGVPVHARTISRVERLWRRCKKNRLVVSLVAGIASAMVLGTISSLWLAHRARQEAAAAQLARLEAETSEKQARRRQYVSEMSAANRALEDNDVALVHQLLDGYMPQPDREDLRDFAWYYLWRASRVSCTAAERYLQADGLRMADVSPDGKYVAVATYLGAYVTLWDLSTGHLIDEFGKRDDSIWANNVVAFSGDSKVLAYPSEDFTEIVLRDLEQGTERQRLKIGDRKTQAVALRFSPVEDLLATSLATSNDLRLWNWKDGSIRTDLVGHEVPVAVLTFSPNGDFLASGDGQGNILIWDLTNMPAKTVLRGHSDSINALAFSPDGKMLASASADRTVRVWETASGLHRWSFPAFPDEARGVAFSPNGELLAAAGRDHVIRLWNATSYESVGIVRNYVGNYALTFLADGRLAFAGEDGFTVCEIRRPPEDRVQAATNQYVDHIALTNVGTDQLLLCALCWTSRRVRIWRVDDEQLPELSSMELEFSPGCMAADLDGSLALCELDGRRVEIHDLSRKAPKQTLLMNRAGAARKAAFSRDGKRFAVGCADGQIATWTMGPDGRFDTNSLREFQAHDKPVACVAYDATGTLLASGSTDTRVKVWNAASGVLEYECDPHNGWLYSVAFSPDGGRFAASFFSPNIAVWSWPPKEPDCVFRAHFMAGSYIAFLQDGRTLVSAGTDRVVKVWDVETRRERCVLRGDASIFTSLAISPNEKVIAAGARDGSVHVYRAASEEQVRMTVSSVGR